MNYIKRYWNEFVAFLASGQIDEAVNARLSALAKVFPEWTALLKERVAKNAEATKAKAAKREALLVQVAELDEELANHADFQEAVDLLTAK